MIPCLDETKETGPTENCGTGSGLFHSCEGCPLSFIKTKCLEYRQGAMRIVDTELVVGSRRNGENGFDSEN